jgi:hypothetical protein
LTISAFQRSRMGVGSCRGHKGVPVQRLKAGEAGFGHRGDVGHIGRAGQAGGGQRNQLAGLDMRQGRGGAAK